MKWSWLACVLALVACDDDGGSKTPAPDASGADAALADAAADAALGTPLPPTRPVGTPRPTPPRPTPCGRRPAPRSTWIWRPSWTPCLAARARPGSRWSRARPT
ncbi:MAG: hypothetical protein R3F60_28645 [bacterium]